MTDNATHESLRALWKGIDANHIAVVLRTSRPGVSYVGSSKEQIIDSLVRGEYQQRPLSMEEAHKVAGAAIERQRDAQERLLRKKIQKAVEVTRQARLQHMRRQAQACVQKHARFFHTISAEYEYISKRYMFTCSVHPKLFHSKLLELHAVMPGFTFSAIAAQLVTIYCTAEQLEHLIELFKDTP